MVHLPPSRILTLVLAALVAAACSSSDDITGNPEGNLDIEFRNFRAEAWDMGLVGGDAVSVTGNAVSGNPTVYRVLTPPIGESLNFFAASEGDTLRTACTITDVTGVSVPPGVALQAGFDVLDCVDW